MRLQLLLDLLCFAAAFFLPVQKEEKSRSDYHAKAKRTKDVTYRSMEAVRRVPLLRKGRVSVLGKTVVCLLKMIISLPLRWDAPPKNCYPTLSINVGVLHHMFNINT